MVMLLGCHVCFTLHSSAFQAGCFRAHAAGSPFVMPLQVLELKPQWPKGYSRVGAAAIGLGDTEKAKAAYEKGVPFTHPVLTIGLHTCKALSKSLLADINSGLLCLAGNSMHMWGMCACAVTCRPCAHHRSLSNYEGLVVEPENEAFRIDLENLKRPPRPGDAGGGLSRPQSLDKLKHTVLACRPGS
jgi:hypothetical protein